MTARVNLQLLRTTVFDSGSLGLLAMVLHQFSAPGKRTVTIKRNGRPVTEVEFDVSEESDTMQLDIDLAQKPKRSRSSADDCDCHTDVLSKASVSLKGYVLFHASSGDSYSASVFDSHGRQEFDSEELSSGDLFALSLLEPGEYDVKNTAGGGTGAIVVKLPPERAKKPLVLETQFVDVVAGRFDPERFDLTSSQGLVFRVGGKARIVVAKKQGKEEKEERPAIGWRRNRPQP